MLHLDADLDGDVAPGGGAVTLFVSEADRYIDAKTLYADAAAEAARREGAAAGPRRVLRPVLWERVDHGDFLAARPEGEARRREVIQAVLDG